MILCDSGPLVAMIDCGDGHHVRCVEASTRLPAELMLTTWPCLTESMHLLYRAGGSPAQEALWSLISNNLLAIHRPASRDWERMRLLMLKYADAPMDLADASLVVTAEVLALKRIFTLDQHFYAYRINDHDSFEIIP